jgi:AbrB family looped-hinge helix DNA binding protein
MKLKDSQFRARINENNQVTISSKIRNDFGIQPGEEIILELKGKVQNEIIALVKLKQKNKED